MNQIPENGPDFNPETYDGPRLECSSCNEWVAYPEDLYLLLYDRENMEGFKPGQPCFYSPGDCSGTLQIVGEIKDKKDCRACAYSYMEPSDPQLVCGHPKAGTFGKYVQHPRKPDGFCTPYAIEFKQHPLRTPEGELKNMS